MGFLKNAMSTPEPEEPDQNATSSKEKLKDELIEDEAHTSPKTSLDQVVAEADLSEDEKQQLDQPLPKDKNNAALEDARKKQTDIAQVAALINELDESLVVIKKPKSIVSEEYRSLRTRLVAELGAEGKGVITLTSAVPREGKTVTSINMGLAFTEMSPGRVLVIEGDLRRPRFSKLFPVPLETGLIQVLKSEAHWSDAIGYIPDLNFAVMSAGGVANEEALKLLSGPTFGQMIDEMRSQFDYIVVDTPPVLSVADPGVYGLHSDLMVLIVRMNRTASSYVNAAINTLEGLNNTVTGILLTGYDPSKAGYGSYGGYGGYRYRYGYRRYGYNYAYRQAYGEDK